MAWLRWIALGASLAAGAAACSYPTFMYGSTTGSGGTGGEATTSTTSTTSTSTSTSASTSSSTTSSSSSTGFPAMCRPLHDAEDCPASQRCTVQDETTGDMHCVPIATPPQAPFEACTNDDGCPAGTWCDWRTDVCMPFCDSAADCIGKGGGDCVSAKNSASKSVPGLSVCTSNCDPVVFTSCGPGAACNYDNNLGSFDCVFSSDKLEGETCTFGECAPTLVCGSTTCLVWCAPVDADNDAQCASFGGYCNHFSNLTPVHNGVTYGYCTF